MEMEVCCTSASLSAMSHIGFMWLWQGDGGSQPSGANMRLQFETNQNKTLQFERAGVSPWQYVNWSGTWVQSTWYKIKVEWTGFCFRAYGDDVLLLAARPDTATDQPKYIGVRVGDSSAPGTFNLRNFKLWVPVLP